jgi:cytochrome P450
MSSEAPRALASSPARAHEAPPGPRGNRYFGRDVLRSRRDPLGFMLDAARRFGDVVSFRAGGESVYLFNHPDHVRQILTNHYGHFLKGRGNVRARRFLGEGLLLSEGDLHRRQRRLAVPAFHRQRLAAYAEVMADYAARTASRWQDGEHVDIAQEMLRLTLAVVGRTLFGADVESRADAVGRAMADATLQFRAFKLPLSNLFERLPLGRLRRFHAGKERLRLLVLRLIEERRRAGADAGDLLSMLLAAEDADDGSRMTPQQVWDEALTIFIAGYDTMSVALTWTFYLLSQNPEAEGRLHAELDAVLGGGRAATFADLPRLPYTEQVLCEAMRVYPPTWRLVRRALREMEVGGYRVPAGALVIVSQYVMHRDERYFPEPERFDPERFTAEARAARPQFAYFPFGGGPRRCLGESFALVEGVILLATLARRWRLRLVAGHPVEPHPQHLLRARHGMPMTPAARPL